MPTTTLTATVVIDSESYQQQVTATSDAVVTAKPSVPAAKTGSLTTRTDDNTGVLTMAAGHGFITSDKVDVFWNGGSRRNMTATVATNAVTVDGGSGDALPALNAAVTAMLPVSVGFVAVGNNIEAIGSHCPVSGWVVYLDDGDAVLVAHQILPNKGGGKAWAAGQEHGGTNPLADETTARVLFSHGDSTQAQTMRAAAAY